MDDIIACCALCEYSVLCEDEDDVMCEIKGKRPALEKCRRFIYDLTKRNPQRARMIKLDPELLELE